MTDFTKKSFKVPGAKLDKSKPHCPGKFAKTCIWAYKLCCICDMIQGHPTEYWRIKQKGA